MLFLSGMHTRNVCSDCDYKVEAGKGKCICEEIKKIKPMMISLFRFSIFVGGFSCLM